MAKRAKKVEKIEAIEPTPEQLTRDTYTFERETRAGQVARGHYRKVRQLETLTNAGMFTDEQAKALSQYRAWADLCDRSLSRDSLDRHMPGTPAGDGPSNALIDAKAKVALCEEAARALKDVLRAVIVNDASPAAWAMEKHGSRDHCRTVCGLRICYPAAKDWAVKRVKDELRTAARRILSEIGA